MPAPIQNCNVKVACECPKEWSRLTPTDRDGVRFCQQCSQEVFYCQTAGEVSKHASAGHCVAMQLEETAEPVPTTIHKKLSRIRKPFVGIICEVETIDSPEDETSTEIRDIGLAGDDEVKDARNEHEAKSEASGDDGVDKAT